MSESKKHEASPVNDLFQEVYVTTYFKTILQCQIRIISLLESKEEDEVFREIANLHTALMDETLQEHKERILSSQKFNKG